MIIVRIPDQWDECPGWYLNVLYSDPMGVIDDVLKEYNATFTVPMRGDPGDTCEYATFYDDHLYALFLLRWS